MKKYTKIENTPLKFHNFLRYFSLPIGILGAIFQIFRDVVTLSSAFVSDSNIISLDITYSFIYLIALCFAFTGLNKWKQYGYYGIITVACMLAGERLLTSIVIVQYSEQMSQLELRAFFLSLTCFTIPVIIYYRKRRFLFFAKESSTELSDEKKQTQVIETKSSNKQKSLGKDIYCKKCGGLIEPISKKCNKCGKQYFNIQIYIYPSVIVLLALALAIFIIAYALQFARSVNVSKEYEDRIDRLTNEIEKLNDEISYKDRKISYYKPKGECYDDIVNSLKNSNIGYAASNFKTDESVIVVSKHEKNRKINLTAYSSLGRTVSVSYSSNAARIDFDKEKWTSSTPLTILPNEEGSTIVTFEDCDDNKSFKILIIVTE